MSKAEMNLDKIAQLTRLVVGDTDGRKIGDERAALRLISVHIPELCAVIASRDEALRAERATVARLQAELAGREATIKQLESVIDLQRIRVTGVSAVST